MVIAGSASDPRARAIDEYLVVAAQGGDRDALAQLARRWHRRLVAHGWRLTRDSGLAEDIAQAAWIEIIRDLPRLRDERAFPAWAYRIVTRRAARRIGSDAMERLHGEGLDEEIAGSGPDGEDAAEGSRLRAAIAALPPIHRAALALHYFDGLGIADIAVALTIPAGTVKTRLMHARQRLRARFEGEDHDPD